MTAFAHRPRPAAIRARLACATGAAVLAALVVAGLGCRTAERPGAQGPPTASAPPRRPAPQLAPGERWNLLLVTLDTVRADVLKPLGSPRVVAPQLERLAADGVLCTAAEATTPLTLPSHCSILTGTYPARHGVRHNARYALSPDHVSMATVLQREGYDTAAFVAAFPLAPEFGTNQGFAVYDATFDRTKGLDSERPATAVNAKAIPWLQKQRAAPFFAWVHYFDAHDPYVPPEPHASRFPDAPYLGEVAAVDAALGELLATLERVGKLEKTLVVVAADHGEGLGEHGELFHGLLLHGATSHVPLVFWGGPLERGPREIGFPVSLTDIAPTALALLGVAAPAAVQGVDLSPWARGGTGDAPRTGAIAETWYGWFEFGWSPLRGIRSESHRYVEAPTPELYDLRKDPRETRNVAAREEDVAQELRGELLAQEARVRDEGASAGAVKEMTQQELEALQSLGYVASGGGVAVDTASVPAGPDPKAMMPLHARYDEARALLDRGNPTAALSVLDEIIAKDPGNLRFRGKRAMALAFLGRADEAEAEWRGMIARDPHDFQAYWDLATLHELGGRTRRALGVLRELQSVEPTYVGVTERMATLLAMLGETDEALALLLGPESAPPPGGDRLALAGRLALRAGQAERGVGLLERAASADPPGLVEPWRLESARSEAAGKRGAALSTLQGATHAREGDVEAWSALCHAALRAGDAELALGACRKLAGSPGHEPADQGALVRALLLAGQAGEARAAGDALLMRSPGWWWVHRARAEDAEARGDAEGARRALEAWLDLDPDSRPARAGLARLTSKR